MINVAVFCGSASSIEERYLVQASRVGQLLASRGYGLVFGGSKGGMARKLFDGFLNTANSGSVLSVVGSTVDDNISPPGPRCRTLVYESLGARKEAMLAMSQLVVVLPGGIGTIDELVHLLALRSTGKPVPPFIVCDYWLDFADLFRYFLTLVDKKFSRERYFACDIIRTEDELIGKIGEYGSSNPNGTGRAIRHSQERG